MNAVNNTIAILQARMSSSRLPGKVLKKILGKPMLLLHIERLRRAKVLNTIFVATSVSPDDDAIAQVCLENGIRCFRGDLNDVLGRFYNLIKSQVEVPKVEHVVRLTADCPLADPQVIDQMVDFYLSGDFDYVTNAIEPTFPHGLDVEILRFSALEAAMKESRLSYDREHVCPFISEQPKRFKIGHFKQEKDLSQYRWTVDYPEDFEAVRTIYEALYPVNPNFTTDDILTLIAKHPEIDKINFKQRRTHQVSGAKKVFIRVDSSEEIGTGHVMRCLALARELEQQDMEIEFFCKDLKGNIADLVLAPEFKVIKLSDGPIDQKRDANECIAILNEKKEGRSYLFIVDHYLLDAVWEKEVRKCAQNLLVIDDLANRSHFCDYLIDQNYYLNKDIRYDHLLNADCIKFLGPEYALLRKEFSCARENAIPRVGGIRNILVFMGGADSVNETAKVLKGLKLLNREGLKVSVVIGVANTHKEEINSLCKEAGYLCLPHVKEISRLMLEVDLAIGAGGTTTWERCCLGLPAIVCVTADNQEQLAHDVAAVGAHINLGWTQLIIPESYKKAIESLTPEKIRTMSQKGMALVDGLGCQRVTENIRGIL